LFLEVRKETLAPLWLVTDAVSPTQQQPRIIIN